jgi:alpha-N-acetylglucosamine transferase
MCVNKLELWYLHEFKTVLWLDTDTLILRNMDRLLESKMQGNGLIGQYDASLDCWDGLDAIWNWLSGKSFCAGVMLLAPEPPLVDQIIQFAKTKSKSLFGCRQNEQTFLPQFFKRLNRNVSLFDKSEVYMSADCHDPGIVHCAARRKGCTTKFKALAASMRASSELF